MPEIVVTHLPKSEVKLEFTVSPEEARPYLEEAVKELSSSRPIPGFRPGKVPFADGMRLYGPMVVLEASLERIIRSAYVRAVVDKQLSPVGSPSVNVDQITPDQPIKFTIIAPLEPTVTKLPEPKDCSVERKGTKIEEKQIDETIDQVRKMRRVESPVERAATADDLVVIDLEMKKDNVIIDGGAGTGYRVYLSEEHYIPGFSKELVGIKAGDERTFTLPFPKEHYQKHVAGHNIDFTVKAKQVFELQLPEMDEAFTKSLGAESVEDLRKKVRENMEQEANQKSDEAAEIAMLEQLSEKATFSDIPEILVNEEVRRMLGELQQGIDQQGMKWDDYLSSIKKTMDDLKLEFAPQAVRRIKSAVLIKAFAKQANIEVNDTEVDEEIDHILTSLRKGDNETRERVSSPDYREYVMVQMRNRKALEWLKDQCVKQ
ncbi:trigger factor [Patescibacteria group bacterium]|nr:trigger factor [Patescibacteria group bacterium]